MLIVISLFMGAKLIDPMMADPTGIDDMSTAEIVDELIIRLELTNGIEFVDRSTLLKLRGFIAEELIFRRKEQSEC